MSRIGKMPVKVPKGVEVKVSQDTISIKGPKGALQQKLFKGIHVKVEGDEILVSVDEQVEDIGKMHGLYRALIQNMVLGSTEGFSTNLEMIGVGYRAAIQGKLLDIQVGLSHPTKLDIPEGIAVKVEKGTVITVSGHDKQAVGQFAAVIRGIRPPEPYQGKGIRYQGEYVRKKAGKAAAKK